MNTGFEHVPAEPSLPDEGCLRRVATVTKPSVGAPAAAAGLSGAKVLAMAGGFGVLAGGGALGYRGASGGSTPPGTTPPATTPPGGITIPTPPGSITQQGGGVPVPEPASLALFLVAIVAFAASRYRHRPGRDAA